MVRESLVRPLLCILVLLCLASSAAADQTCQPPGGTQFPAPPAGFTHTAVTSGEWGDSATWGGKTPPASGAIVCIPRGYKVMVAPGQSARLRFIQVDGVLQMRSDVSTQLYVDTLFVHDGGVFQGGDSTASPVKADVTAEVVFISWNGLKIDLTWDPEEKSRGLFSMGSVKVYGDFKTHMVPMTADALKGSTHLTLDSAPSNWRVGDTLVLPGSYFREVSEGASSQDEQLMITAISGKVIDFTTDLNTVKGLAQDHVRPQSDLRFHVANLTRNVIFRSELPADPALRGHVMLMNKDVTISGARFSNLGRTNKRVPLDDVIVQCLSDGVPYACPADGGTAKEYKAARNLGEIKNRRGRYALHFHLNGTSPGLPSSPATVSDTVVDGAIGWGFVNHGSQVDFTEDVAYDFAGAGFVTEAGNELGTFVNDVAIRGTGPGDGHYLPNQIVFQNPERPQPLADFGFTGDGFWFQGPAIQAMNNVAAGCNGVGMIWFTTGQPDVNSLPVDGSPGQEQYTFFRRDDLKTVYAGFDGLGSFSPRSWHFDTADTTDKVVIADLPILKCDGFEGYGNLVGFRLRFNNFKLGETSWYNEFSYDAHIVDAGEGRLRQSLSNITVWNNEYGLYPNYTARGDWLNVKVVNRLDYDPKNAHAGAHFEQHLDESKFTNLTIDGYEVAGLLKVIDKKVFDNSDGIVFTTKPMYGNFASAQTLNNGTSACQTLEKVATATTGIPTSRTLSWIPIPNTNQKRFLVRYRASGDQQWRMVDTKDTSVTLNRLKTGTTYTYQVMAGCKDSMGNEIGASDYTPPARFNT